MCQNIQGHPERERLAMVAQKKAWKSGGPIAGLASGADPRKSTGRGMSASGKRNIADWQANELAKASDTVLLPSQNAVPMRLSTNIQSSTLAFGKGSTFKRRKTDTSAGGIPGAFERAMATEEAVLARRKASDGTTGSPKRGKQKAPPSLQKEIERHWNEETRDVLGTFQAMRQELLQRKQDAGLLGADLVLTREYSYYDLVGSAQLASVELELADVLSGVREAKVRARDLIAVDAQERKLSSPNVNAGSRHDELSSTHRAGIIDEAVQDTAVMRELARIIRERALEMSESRKGGHKL